MGEEGRETKNSEIDLRCLVVLYVMSMAYVSFVVRTLAPLAFIWERGFLPSIDRNKPEPDRRLQCKT